MQIACIFCDLAKAFECIFKFCYLKYISMEFEKYLKFCSGPIEIIE